MTAPAGFLAALELAAKHSAQAEDEFRRDWAERLKALERERAFQKSRERQSDHWPVSTARL